MNIDDEKAYNIIGHFIKSLHDDKHYKSLPSELKLTVRMSICNLLLLETSEHNIDRLNSLVDDLKEISLNAINKSKECDDAGE